MKLYWAKQGLVSVCFLLLGSGAGGQETLPIVVHANQLTEMQRAINKLELACAPIPQG